MRFQVSVAIWSITLSRSCSSGVRMSAAARNVTESRFGCRRPQTVTHDVTYLQTLLRNLTGPQINNGQWLDSSPSNCGHFKRRPTLSHLFSNFVYFVFAAVVEPYDWICHCPIYISVVVLRDIGSLTEKHAWFLRYFAHTHRYHCIIIILLSALSSKQGASI